MSGIWTRLRETVERHGSAALAGIVATAGSTPREAGARMVVRPDGAFYGTVGGGRLEFEALGEAKAALAVGRGPALVRQWPLGPNLGQCCGGAVTILIETFDARDLGEIGRLAELQKAGAFLVMAERDGDGRMLRRLAAAEGLTCAQDGTFAERFGERRRPLLLFGAGHVGRALVLALAPLPFAVRWIDSRPDQFPDAVPPNVTPVLSEAPASEITAAPDGAFVLVMTHSHPLDFEIVIAALQRDTFGFVGLIGSATKRARCLSLARQMGLTERQTAALVCPIGIAEISGKAPPVIATAVAAQLLAADETLVR